MRALTAEQALDAWEAGCDRMSVGRALALLGAAYPDDPPEALASLSVGERDARLLRWRARQGGAALPCAARCPACGEWLEFAVEATALLAAPREIAEPVVHADGFTVRYRLLDSHDLAAALAGGRDARQALIERCVVEASRDGAPVAPDALPAAVIDALEARLEAADPLADVALDLRCGACEHAWSAPFDIVDYLWSELAAQAQRLLREVDALARAYGWSEAEILALGPARRRLYLEMVDG